ncbi:PRC-barrel domain-containing protein [Qipengyuania gaetbuli]|nr:PRC-barrel domain-containing protein [Qipengyuania gaetbuli]
MTNHATMLERASDGDVAHDETAALIASDKVEGTTVYNKNGEKLGQIENFMVGKRTGRVEYAVMSFGGILGLGKNHYPIPWDRLEYNVGIGGYIVDIDKEALKDAPSYAQDDQPQFNSDYVVGVRSYYGIPY